MFVYGYCYPSEEGKAGFRPMGKDINEEKICDIIKEKILASKKVKELPEDAPRIVTYVFGDAKARAFINGIPTGYIYFNLRDI